MTRVQARRRALVVLVAGAVVATLGVPGAGASTTSPRAASATSPLSALPAGPVPVGVPYGIGKRIYLNGVQYDLTSRWSALTNGQGFAELAQVTSTRGTVVWVIGLNAIDALGQVGTLRPGGTPVVINEVNDYRVAATSGGVLAGGASGYGGTVQPFTLTGKSFGPAFTDPFPSVPYFVGADAAGGSLVFRASDDPAPTQSFRMYPGYAAVRLPYDNTFGVGGGAGWLATADSLGSVCYRTAALATPATLRARICSLTVPMLSADGTKAVVVQGNHVRLYDTATGAQINATNAPTLPFQGRYTTGTYAGQLAGYYPFAWESATTYLVYARDGAAMDILRCFLDRTCQRAVTSYPRAGITHIATASSAA